MLDLVILTANERLLARQYRLEEYFQHNKNYILFVIEMKEIMDKRFRGITQSDWAKNGFVHLAQEVLKYSDPLYNHVNNMHAGRHGGTNIPTEDWKCLCHVSSKIIVHMGWAIEAKE